MGALATVLPLGRRDDDLQRVYFDAHRELSRRGSIPGVRLDADTVLFLLHVLSKGPGYAAYRRNTARRFNVKERTVSSWHARLRAVELGGKPLLTTGCGNGLGSPLNAPMPWDPSRRPSRHPNLHGYRVAAAELLERLEEAAAGERQERVRTAAERARRRRVAELGAPLPRAKEPETPVSDADVQAVEAAWNALRMPPGTTGRGATVTRAEHRTIAARLRGGWSRDELLSVVAGAGADASLRSGSKRSPFEYAFAAFGGIMQRFAAEGRRLAASVGSTSLQNPARTLVVGSHAIKNGSLKTATAERQRPQPAPREPGGESGTAPEAPSSRRDAVATFTPDARARLRGDQQRRPPSGPVSWSKEREPRREGEHDSSQTLGGARSVLDLLDRPGKSAELAGEHARNRNRRPQR